MGWGLVTNGGPLQNSLQSDLIVPVDNRDCERVFGPQVDINSQRCAVGTAGQGICIGDDGGPMIIHRYFIQQYVAASRLRQHRT